jgi:hypothetical protein
MWRILRVLFPNMRMPDHLLEQVDLKTGWGVLTPVIFGFRSHVLSRPRPGVRRFRAVIFMWFTIAISTKIGLVCLLLASMGLIVVLFGGFSTLSLLPFVLLTVPQLFLAFLCGAHAVIAFVLARPLTFHKMSGLYWRGWRPKTMVRSSDSKSGWLSAIRAVQVLGRRGMYMEINLVLRDGSRVHVTGGGLLFFNAHVLKEATDLADFLGVDLWDATGCRPRSPRAQAA